MIQLFKKSAIFICVLGLIARPVMAPDEREIKPPSSVPVGRILVNVNSPTDGFMTIQAELSTGEIFCDYFGIALNGTLSQIDDVDETNIQGIVNWNINHGVPSCVLNHDHLSNEDFSVDFDNPEIQQLLQHTDPRWKAEFKRQHADLSDKDWFYTDAERADRQEREQREREAKAAEEARKTQEKAVADAKAAKEAEAKRIAEKKQREEKEQLEREAKEKAEEKRQREQLQTERAEKERLEKKQREEQLRQAKEEKEEQQRKAEEFRKAKARAEADEKRIAQEESNRKAEEVRKANEARKAEEAQKAEAARKETERKKNEAKERVEKEQRDYAELEKKRQQLINEEKNITDPVKKEEKLKEVQQITKQQADLVQKIKADATKITENSKLQDDIQRLSNETDEKIKAAEKAVNLAKQSALCEKASKLARESLKDPLSPDETGTGLPWLDDGSWTFPEEASEAIKNSDLEKEDKDTAERILHFVEALANLSEDETKNLALNRLADTDCIRRCSPETATTINGGNANKEAKYLLSNKNIELLLLAALVDLDALSELGDENAQKDAKAAKKLVDALNKLVHNNPGIHKILLEPLDGNDGSNNVISAATKISSKLHLEAPTRVDVATAFVKDNPVIIGTGCAGAGLVLTIAGLAARLAWLIEKAYQAQLNEPKPKDRLEVAEEKVKQTATQAATKIQHWWKNLREKPAAAPKPVAKKAAPKNVTSAKSPSNRTTKQPTARMSAVKKTTVKKPSSANIAPKAAAKPRRVASTSPRRKTTSPARKATPTKRPASAVRKTRGAKRVGARG